MSSFLSGELNSDKWGDKIRRLRREKDWSQKDLADKLGVHPQTVSDIERGVNQFTLERLNRVLQALGYRATIELEKREKKTVADWGPLKATEPDVRKRIRLARQFAEDLAKRLYEQFDVEAVYCFGSLVEDGGASFTLESDIDLVVEGLDESKLFSATSELEMEVAESRSDYRQFSFDLVRVEDFVRDPSGELVAEGRAVVLPEG